MLNLVNDHLFVQNKVNKRRIETFQVLENINSADFIMLKKILKRKETKSLHCCVTKRTVVVVGEDCEGHAFDLS